MLDGWSSNLQVYILIMSILAKDASPSVIKQLHSMTVGNMFPGHTAFVDHSSDVADPLACHDIHSNNPILHSSLMLDTNPRCHTWNRLVKLMQGRIAPQVRHKRFLKSSCFDMSSSTLCNQSLFRVPCARMTKLMHAVGFLAACRQLTCLSRTDVYLVLAHD